MGVFNDDIDHNSNYPDCIFIFGGYTVTDHDIYCYNITSGDFYSLIK